jgi:hypothetical protein
MLSRAHAFEGGLTAMWGASAFTRHPVGELILLAEELRCEYELKSIVIPFCDRDHVDQALRGSAARAEAAALSVWQNELDLDMTAAAARAAAFDLPLVACATNLTVQFASELLALGGKDMAFICVDRRKVLHSSEALRRLWASPLTPQLLASYQPIVLSEATTARIASAAIAYGDQLVPGGLGAAWAKRGIESAQLACALLVVEDDEFALIRRASAALASGHQAHQALEQLKIALRQSAVSHILLPNGAKLDRAQEAIANCCEAAAFGLAAEEVHLQSFCRAGSAGGMMDADTLVARLACHPDIACIASGEWGEQSDLIAPSNYSDGVSTLALRYFAGERARARKRRSVGAGDASSTMRQDGQNQPRLVRIGQPIRGVELDAEALKALALEVEYMRAIRVPQQREAALCLLTLVSLGWGGRPLNSNQGSNPLWNAELTWRRVCYESQDLNEAALYFARGTRASCVCQALAVHVDGVASRRLRPPTAELVTTRWAHAAASWSDDERVRELAACREAQPLAACSLWLRTSVALDAAPCSGLALVAGTESEHGVPVPLPDSHGRDVERGGFTRAIAQSCRPDDCSDDARFAAEWLPATGAGRVAAGGAGAAGRGGGVGQQGRGRGGVRNRQAPQHFVPGVAVQPVAPQPAAHRRRYRRNQRTGATY